MARLLAVGTLKRGFPLHDKGLAGARYEGEYRTRERFPMIIAGAWFAPMVLNQPGAGLQIKGELYEISEATLSTLDQLESVGIPGNERIVIAADPLGAGRSVEALMFVKAPALAVPVHSGYIADYQDRRFIPPSRR